MDLFNTSRQLLFSKDVLVLLGLCLVGASMGIPYFQMGTQKSLMFADGTANCFGSCTKGTCTLENPNNSCYSVQAFMVLAFIFGFIALTSSFTMFNLRNMLRKFVPDYLLGVTVLISIALLCDLIAFILVLCDNTAGYVSGSSVATAAESGKLQLIDGFGTHLASVIVLFLALFMSSCSCACSFK